MIVRRALQAGIITKLGCHTFRVTGITVYLLNGGLLEYAQQMAAHESARRRSSTTAAMVRSHSIRSNELLSKGCFHSNRSLEPN